jgi:hypothetical protein
MSAILRAIKKGSKSGDSLFIFISLPLFLLLTHVLINLFDHVSEFVNVFRVDTYIVFLAQVPITFEGLSLLPVDSTVISVLHMILIAPTLVQLLQLLFGVGRGLLLELVRLNLRAGTIP